LKGLSRHQPDIIVIETRDNSFSEISSLLLSKGYLLLGDLSSDPISGSETNEIPEHRDLIWVNGMQLELVSRIYLSLSKLSIN
jgi:hypothetical protein